ncbi:hypothetical protein [Kordiimonas marina]|uniref:hypothetical protein n=1 Tax=Kordiimonas marina TaxID=2872312 RepID=UPI001FF4B7EC|nr:hypothetical protein [Kordiimonas marina]MCJ9428506.1 hypothetical protein [Kordiimonas marina]
MLFKGYFKAALVLSFALSGTSAVVAKPGANGKPMACHMESKAGCPCREAQKKRGDEA